jgi:hypothetical protein
MVYLGASPSRFSQKGKRRPIGTIGIGVVGLRAGDARTAEALLQQYEQWSDRNKVGQINGLKGSRDSLLTADENREALNINSLGYCYLMTFHTQQSAVSLSA